MMYYVLNIELENIQIDSIYLKSSVSDKLTHVGLVAMVPAAIH